MKIAIVIASYRHDWGYQENAWVQQAVEDGHTVRVLTSGPADALTEQTVGTAGRYEQQHVKTLVFAHRFFAADTTPALLDYQPDVIMWAEPSTYFGRQLAQDPRLARFLVVSFWSENLGMHEFDWRKPGLPLKQRLYAWTWRLLRCREIRRALCRSQLIVGATLQTADILRLCCDRSVAWPELESRYMHAPLGYNTRDFAWNPALREATRRRLGLGPEELVVCFSSRFAVDKVRDITTVVTGFQEALVRVPALRALIIGFTDNEVSAEFRRLIAAHPSSQRIQCQTFAKPAQLNELYNASDIAVFPNATISAQAALGTGLYTCLADNGSMAALITQPEQGAFFEYGHPRALADKLVDAVGALGPLTDQQRIQARTRRAEVGRWLGYDRILAQVFARLKNCPAPGALAGSTGES
jgi:glycosyltransferase involved in cell wall biosynthesis